MKCLSFFFLMGYAGALWSQEVGQGAPPGIAAQFVQAYFRNGFNTLTAAQPVGAVRNFGDGGYLQEFQDAKKTSGVKFALVKGAESTDPVFQIYPAMYSYYTSVTVAKAGFPTSDTGSCTAQGASSFCTFQLFDGNYALFVYTTSFTSADEQRAYTVKDAFYTRWTSVGGTSGIGPATSAETNITSKTGITAVVQQYTAGAMYSITSGAFTGKVFPVTGKAFTLYNTLGLHNGALGIPLSDELQAPGGKFRQTFEGGQIEYSATTDPVVRPAVGGVQLSISAGDVTRLSLGDTITVTAVVTATTGERLTDREVTWTTSNSRVVSVQATGATALLRATGGGTAILTAVSEGKASDRVTIFVAAPCCQVGEGAPTASIQQAFQDAVTRLRLTVKLPAANPVTRSGLGYVQELQSPDATQRYLLCRSDRSPGVFIVMGDLLRAYESEGGPSGKLAYPAGDATAAGRQVFEGGILAGSPVYLVTGAIADRWAALGYEGGALGAPAGAPTPALSFRGVPGTMQLFRNGALVSSQALTPARVYTVLGLILAKYLSTGGIGGVLGLPLGDEYARDGRRRQDFEGGALEYGPGDTEAQLEELERRPQITVTPSKVTAGARVRIAVGGFPSQSAIRVTFSGDGAGGPFSVETQNGSYVWESPVPRTASSGFITIRAQQVNGQSTATATYTITALAEAGPRLTKVRGDTQTGLPGARLLTPLTVSLKDADGTPLVGVPVAFAASPGASVLTEATVTNDAGEAQTIARLQTGDGIALFTAEAAGVLTTFSARSAASTLPNFPRQTQAGSFNLGATQVPVSQKGALLAAVSSILRYAQNRGELPSSLGPAEPGVLNDFLKGYCPLDVIGGRICDGYLTVAGAGEPVVNLWRLRDFVGGLLNVQVLKPGEEPVRDAIAEGRPVLLALRMTSGDAVVGSHYVVAVGVGIDGGLVIQDPSPVLNRTRLEDYLTGLRLAGREVKGEILDALVLLPQSASPTGFLVTSAGAKLSVRSRAGECGKTLEWPGALVVAQGGAITPSSVQSNLYYCEGTQGTHVLESPGAPSTLTDLGSPGRVSQASAGGEYLVSRPTSQWQLDPVQVSLSAADVVNAATFTRDLAPGTLAAIFGTGLGRRGISTQVEVGGRQARIQSADEFRLLVEIPPDLSAGEFPLVVQSPSGSAQTTITLRETAPYIFIDESTKLAAVANSNGRSNTALNPAARGETVTVYATGLGSVRPQGTAQIADRTVVALVQGGELAVSFAGLAPNLPGVYAVNIPIPADAVPGLSLSLALRVDGIESNRVEISIR